MKQLLILALFLLFITPAKAEESYTVPEGFTACISPAVAHELLGAMYVKDAEYVFHMLKDKRCMQFKGGTKVSQEPDSLSPGGVMKVHIHIETFDPAVLYTHPWFMVFTKKPV